VHAYTRNDVARIFKLPPARLLYWQRAALVEPSLTIGSQRAFAFCDLVGIKSLLALRAGGVSLRRIRRAVEHLRRLMPEVENPLRALRLWGEAPRRVVVSHADHLFEANGQLLLDFEASALEPNVVEPLRADGGIEASAASARALARSWFEEGCRLDADARTYAAAVEAYRRAVALDPDFADAHCNLGAVYYNQGRKQEAQHAFRDALTANSHHVEAHFNVATLLEEKNRVGAALVHLKCALRSDPLYADAHLSLALLYEKLELEHTASQYWRRYLQLRPRGHWAEVARERLAE